MQSHRVKLRLLFERPLDVFCLQLALVIRDHELIQMRLSPHLQQHPEYLLPFLRRPLVEEFIEFRPLCFPCLAHQLYVLPPFDVQVC